MKIILIDSGTTNSRLRLVDETQNKVEDHIKIQIGVRNTAIEGNNNSLKIQLKKSIQQLLNNNDLDVKDIRFIVASGMITSNLGIHEVPHIPSPANLRDFVKNVAVAQLDEFIGIPCIFVPGMTNNVAEHANFIDNLNAYDVMRGEEVEALGLLKQFEMEGKGVVVLPGSHTKYVTVDEHKALTSSISTLGGELLQAIQKETILSRSLDNTLIKEVDCHMLEKGFAFSRKYGLTRTLYGIRLIDLFSDSNENERANFFVGAVIHEDISALFQSVRKDDVQWIIVGGTSPLKKAFVHLLQTSSLAAKILEATDTQVEHSLVEGAREIAMEYIKLYEKSNK